MGFAERLKKYRLEKGFTQETLAKRLFISKKAVSKWETGRGMPDPSLLPHIARELGVTIDDLFDKEETKAFYHTYHESVDEHALYVQSYQKQRIVTSIWRLVCAVLCVVAVTLGAFYAKYYTAYQALTLRAERMVYWKDYAKTDSDWQSYRIDAQTSFAIEAEENAAVVVVLQETVYRADGSIAEQKTFREESHSIYFNEKTQQIAEGFPNEYLLERVTVLGKNRGVNNINATYCQSSGAHFLSYRHLGSKYFGENYITVRIPKDDRVGITMTVETDDGECVKAQGSEKPQTRYSGFAPVLHGTELKGLRLSLFGEEAFLELESQRGYFKSELPCGGRIVVIAQTSYGEWGLGLEHARKGTVLPMRIDLIGSSKYKNIQMELSLCIAE